MAMKAFILIGFLVFATSATLLEEHALKFQEFKLMHGKTYENQSEELRRFSIFRENLQSIEEHNALYVKRLVSYEKGINQFTDMSQEEFTAMLTLQSKPTLKNTTKHVDTGLALPDFVDWRNAGEVTKVKDQGICGSCWSFVIAGAVESAYWRKTRKLVTLAEQQLIDCTTDINYGCNGGRIYASMDYVQKKGLQSDKTYKYTGKVGQCHYDGSKVVTNVSSYVRIRNENALQDAVGNVGPVGVTFDSKYLRSYKSGVFAGSPCSKTNRNHGGLVVGYGQERNGMKYWIIKNSWGPKWGEKGYFRLLRGNNECGVGEEGVYPVIN